MCAASDEEQLAYALAHGRVLVTNDADFLRLNASGALHAGIVFYQSGPRSRRPLLSLLLVLAAELSAEEMRNHVEFV